jgi:hypothetical protein
MIRNAALAAVMGAVALLAFTAIANANATILYGGSGCYATGLSDSVSGGYVVLTSATCGGSDVFLSGTSDTGTLSGDWYDDYVDHLFDDASWSYGGHDLCYTQCNGYVNTASWW